MRGARFGHKKKKKKKKKKHGGPANVRECGG
jgi:hypothetical protein